jgi:hypothetical protein
MKPRILTGREAETSEAKARWFQSLSVAERMELLCAYTDLILENNPRVGEQRNAQPTSRSVCVLRKE